MVYQGEQGEILIKPDQEANTLWITQRQLADVFDVDVRTVNEHIGNIFKSGEFDENPTIRNFRIVQKEGSRNVEREIAHYNLDMAIPIGYRINSVRATKFRKWATEILKAHIGQGYTINEARPLTRSKEITLALESIQKLQKKNDAIDKDQVIELIKA